MYISIPDAARIAIESVNLRQDLTDPQKQEIIALLSRVLNRDWFVQWDKDKIIQTLVDYKEKTGRAPTVTNLSETGMPKSLTIQSHFGVKASLFLKQLFPELQRQRPESTKMLSHYEFTTKEQWLCCFHEQYEKHKAEGGGFLRPQEYNLLRDECTPTWYTIAIHCGVKRWNQLKELAAVVDVPSAKTPATGSNVKIKSVRSPYLDLLKEQNDRREAFLVKIEKEEATNR